ncbi:MAG: hypothetical protein Q9N62_12620 [Ghiorsea sp.]|nr:hypothetical protein [Ghiorsea sp.]
MIDRFGSNEDLEGYKRHVEDVIAKQQQVATQQDSYAQANTYSAPKPAAVDPVKAVEPKKAAEPVVKSQQHLHRIIPCCGGCLAALVCLG